MKPRYVATIATTLTLFGGAGVYGVDTVQNPYIDRGEYLELPITSDIPQGEHVKVSKDRAEMTLSGWHGEYEIKITPQIPTAIFGAVTDRPFETVANRPLLSKKVSFRSGDVTAFIEPKEGTENEFDIDFTLHSKPDTNVFTYKIAGAEDFDFWYQPELTAEEIAEGAERPENVVGSYAVYHKTKANHRVGSTNYATGKAFHIYRPKAIDANGAEVWAELNYESGVLSVTVPQEWLEKAAYPVIVDPTLGYTTIGGSTSALGTSLIVDKITTPEALSIAHITVFTAASANVKGLLFDYPSGTGDNDGTIRTDGVTNVTAANFNPQWITMSFASPHALSASTNYWAGFVADSSNTAYYDAGSSGDGGYENPYTSYATPGDFTNLNFNNRNNSIYATYQDSDECSGEGCGPFTALFQGAGTFSWTVPANVNTAEMACWGGGGGGDVIATSAGGGGGGGAFASSTVTVTPNDIWTVVVGSGGLGDTSPTAGGNSSIALAFATSTLAAGGSEATNTTGGAGGTTAASIGDVEFAGGAGANGDTTGDVGGGGGGSAGPHGAGGAGAAGAAGVGGGGGGGNGGSNGSSFNGGSSTNGGAGGTGDVNGSTAPDGGAGGASLNGGGGGGGGDDGDRGGYGGHPGGGGAGGEIVSSGYGSGASGQCVITYTSVASGGGGGSILDQSVIFFD